MKGARSCSSRHSMRCSQGKKGCGARFVLPKNPNLYVHDVKCPFCKSTHVNSVEKAMQKQRDKRQLCRCLNMPFPHDKGGIVGCVHSKEFAAGMTAEDIHRYENIVNTKRGNFA